MTIFNVQSDPDAVVQRFEGVDGLIVSALDAAEAKALAAGRYNEAAAVWAASTAAAIAAPAFDTDGWTFRVRINTEIPVDVSVVGQPGSTFTDTMTALGEALTLAPFSSDGNTPLSDAAYDDLILTIMPGASGWDIGDRTITFTVTPPAGFPSSYTFNTNRIVDNIVDQGLLDDDLAINFKTQPELDAAFPVIVVAYKQ